MRTIEPIAVRRFSRSHASSRSTITARAAPAITIVAALSRKAPRIWNRAPANIAMLSIAPPIRQKRSSPVISGRCMNCVAIQGITT